MGELSFSLLFVAKMPRRAIGRHVAVLPTATAATSPPLNSAGLAGRSSPAELEAHRRWRPEGRVGPETRTARQPLPPGGDGRGVLGRAARWGRVRWVDKPHSRNRFGSGITCAYLAPVGGDGGGG